MTLWFAALLWMAVEEAAGPQIEEPSPAPAVASPGVSAGLPVDAARAPGAAPARPLPKLAMAESATVPAPAENLTLAERAARLQRAIEADVEHLDLLQATLEDKEAEFRRASEEFKRVDTDVAEQKKQIEATATEGEPESESKVAAALADLDKRRQLARERFDLAIEARRTAQEQIAELQSKIERDRAALDKLLAPREPEPKQAETASQPPAPAALEQPASISAPAGDAAPAAVGPAAPGPPAVQAPAAGPVAAQAATAAAQASTLPGTAAAPAEPAPAPSEQAGPKPREDRKLLAAKQQAAKAEAAALEASRDAEEVSRRLELLDKNIALEQQAREAARKQGDNAEQTLRTLEEELQKLLEGAAPLATVQETRRRIRDEQQRLQQSRAEVRQRAGQLDKLHAERAALLSEQLLAMREAEARHAEAEAARKSLESLQNPFALHNVLHWVLDRGPKLLLILLVTAAMRLLIRLVAQRIVALITRHESAGRRQDREKRASTLVGVFHNTCAGILYTGALLMIMDVVGIPIVPLLGGAAVIGLAVAFAAQNLIKDYFYGFMILLEDQYGVNDVVSIGGVTGFVERVTMRVTVLRDLDAVHFVPHGQITTVSNLTHKWSRAVFDVPVSYREDVDRVMEVLVRLAKELRADPAFAPLILEDLEMLGVDSFGESGVVIKSFIKTRPLKQWTVKREMLRRIKRAFDELGIEIPFPHRVVYHRHEEPAAASLHETLDAQRDREAA